MPDIEPSCVVSVPIVRYDEPPLFEMVNGEVTANLLRYDVPVRSGKPVAATCPIGLAGSPATILSCLFSSFVSISDFVYTLGADILFANVAVVDDSSSEAVADELV